MNFSMGQMWLKHLQWKELCLHHLSLAGNSRGDIYLEFHELTICFLVINCSLSNAGSRNVRPCCWSTALIRTLETAVATVPCTMLCTTGIRRWPHCCFSITLISNKKPRQNSLHFNLKVCGIDVLTAAEAGSPFHVQKPKRFLEAVSSDIRTLREIFDVQLSLAHLL